LTARAVYFLSDFGLADEFVGVVHAVIGRIAPRSPVVDITHQVAPHDITGGAATLERAAPWLAGGVVLGVVDPGVGTARRAVAFDAGEGTVLVGPDNGLLLPAARSLHPPGPVAAVRLDTDTGAPGATFAGRDVFAPAAARAARGEPLAALGEPVEPASLVELTLPVASVEGGRVRAQVLWVDRFGNAQLNVTPSVAGPVRLVEVAGRAHPAPVVRSYGDIGPGYALVVDSYGRLAVSANGRAAAEELGLRPGSEVWLCR
jgi:S-adenosylmethionine hydrolase